METLRVLHKCTSAVSHLFLSGTRALLSVVRCTDQEMTIACHGVCMYVGSEVGAGSSGRSHDQSSDVTLQSCDTWGGLAPPIHVPDIPSETVSTRLILYIGSGWNFFCILQDSEVQLPPPPPLEGKSWLPDPPTQHDPHGWGTTQ